MFCNNPNKNTVPHHRSTMQSRSLSYKSSSTVYSNVYTCLFFLFLGALTVLSFTAPFVSAGMPAPELFFEHQLIDHDDPTAGTWSQRYYIWEYGFRGPGFPIFVIMGGEGNIEPQTGLMYPFVADTLANDLGAFVLQPEHRFYGKSLPVRVTSTYDPREKLFTPEQALKDAMKLVRFYQKLLQCSTDRSSPAYCPVVTFGGSYPGWLSAMARLRFPEVVDMAYSASAPMRFYSQQTGQQAYYDHIAEVADKALPGCASAVRSALSTVNDIILSHSASSQWITDESNDKIGNHDNNSTSIVPLSGVQSIDDLAVKLGFCKGSVPSYIKDAQTFADEVFMIFGYCTANDNMANYPPTTSTRLYEMCESFILGESSPMTKVAAFFQHRLPTTNTGCVPMDSQMPTGRNATISGGDWSGDGTGRNGESWDFQTCTLLIEKIGFSEKSMIPPRQWSLDWMNKHCHDRFGVTPQPFKLVFDWGFDYLVDKTNASHILFTNGLNDGWSVAGIKKTLSPTLIALNFPNGAHHSDLNGRVPSADDTPDIQAGFRTTRNILAGWLAELKLPTNENNDFNKSNDKGKSSSSTSSSTTSSSTTSSSEGTIKIERD